MVPDRRGNKRGKDFGVGAERVDVSRLGQRPCDLFNLEPKAPREGASGALTTAPILGSIIEVEVDEPTSFGADVCDQVGGRDAVTVVSVIVILEEEEGRVGHVFSWNKGAPGSGGDVGEDVRVRVGEPVAGDRILVYG